MDGWPFPICGLVDARGIPYLYIRTAAATLLKVSIDVQRGWTDVDGRGWTKKNANCPSCWMHQGLTANETWTMTMQSLMLHARDKTKQKRKK